MATCEKCGRPVGVIGDCVGWRGDEKTINCYAPGKERDCLLLTVEKRDAEIATLRATLADRDARVGAMGAALEYDAAIRAAVASGEAEHPEAQRLAKAFGAAVAKHRAAKLAEVKP